MRKIKINSILHYETRPKPELNSINYIKEVSSYKVIHTIQKVRLGIVIQTINNIYPAKVGWMIKARRFWLAFHPDGRVWAALTQKQVTAELIATYGYNLSDKS